jgi:hypothetical protein
MTWQISGLSGLLATEVLSGIWIQSLADRTALPAHPAIIRIPAPPGSEVVRVPDVGMFGYDLLGQVSPDETADPNLTAHDEDAVDITLYRYSKYYDVSDLAALRDASDVIRAETFAMDALISAGATLRDIVANLVGNFVSTTGTSGADMTFEDYLDAITNLQIAKVQGPYLSILAPVQVGDLRKDLALNSGGAIQYNAAPQRMLDGAKSMGLQGDLAGGSIFMTDSVATSGGNRLGGMFGRGAIGYCLAAPVADPDFPQIVLGSEVLFEKSRDAVTSVTQYVSHMNVGASELQDLAGNSIITDA